MIEQKTERAADCLPYIGKVVTIAVAFYAYNEEEPRELVTSGTLEGVVDLYAKDNTEIVTSSWVFQGKIGTLQINWSDASVFGQAVKEILAVEVTTYDPETVPLNRLELLHPGDVISATLWGANTRYTLVVPEHGENLFYVFQDKDGRFVRRVDIDTDSITFHGKRVSE